MADNVGNLSQLTPVPNVLEFNFDSTQSTQSSQLTPAQRQVEQYGDDDGDCLDLDDSQTCLKQLLVSAHERVPVTPENVDSVYETISHDVSPPEDSNWPLLDKIQDYFRTLVKSAFISRIISEADSREDRLEEIRRTVFESCVKSSDYPFPKDVDLKRRKNARKGKGENIISKLANDIYTIMSVQENNSYDDLKEVLSLPKTFPKPDLNMSVQDASSNVCLHEIRLLKNQLIQCQSDIVIMKQEKQTHRKDVEKDLKSLKCDINALKKELNSEMDILRLDIQRIEGEKSSGLACVKSSLKLVNNDIKQSKDYTDSLFNDILERMVNVNKKVDRQLGKMDSRVSELNRSMNNRESSKHNAKHSDNTSNERTTSVPSHNDPPIAPRRGDLRPTYQILANEQSYRDIVTKPVDRSTSNLYNSQSHKDPSEINHLSRQRSSSHANHELIDVDSNTQTSNCGGVAQFPQDARATHESDARMNRSPENGPNSTIQTAPQQFIPVLLSNGVNNTDNSASDLRRSSIANPDGNVCVGMPVGCYNDGDGDFTDSVIKKTKRFYGGNGGESDTDLSADIVSRKPRIDRNNNQGDNNPNTAHNRPYGHNHHDNYGKYRGGHGDYHHPRGHDGYGYRYQTNGYQYSEHDAY